MCRLENNANFCLNTTEQLMLSYQKIFSAYIGGQEKRHFLKMTHLINY